MDNSKGPRSPKVFITALVFVVLFAGGIAAGYFFFMKTTKKTVLKGPETARPAGAATTIQVYFPVEDRLQAEDRQVPRPPSRLASARVTVEEFLKGPKTAGESYVPEGARLLGVYDGEDGILYIDLSDEFRRNLKVDALGEFLLLRGLYESVLTNVYGVADVKILIERAETETLGGHISLLRPLGETVSQTLVEE